MTGTTLRAKRTRHSLRTAAAAKAKARRRTFRETFGVWLARRKERAARERVALE